LPELFEEGQGSLRLSFAVESLIRHALVFIPEDFKVEVKSDVYDSRIDKVIQSCVKERRLVSNADVAKIAGTSVQNFEKLFRKKTGLSPRKFQQIRQMQWAADKLRLTDLSIDEIAEKSGYLNRHNFTRAFKLFFGINPAAYRKKSLN
ncbi:MAG: helix-turn-helix transcriptional regulator, partial [Lentisphaeria bacterium]|nr:helix-turn-helix transcriptional regulator [Lentisphaeria bacterium]